MKSSNFICTVGPTNNSPECIERMVYKGMSVARLNMSHGTYDEHEKSIVNIKIAAESYRNRTKYQAPLAIAIDLRSQEIRTGKIHQQFENTGQLLKVGDTLRLQNNNQIGDVPTPEMIYISCDIIDKSLRKKQEIFIDDGKIALVVDEIYGGTVTCKVTKGGILGRNRCVYVPEIWKEMNFPKVTERDKLDINFAVKNEVDFIFASYVESGEWIDEIRKILGEAGSETEIYAKIQNPSGIDAIDEILAKADGIIFKPTMEIEPKVTEFVQNFLLSRSKQNMKPCFINIDAKLVSTQLYQVVHWKIKSGDGLVLTHELAEGKKKPLDTMEILGSVELCLHNNETVNENDELPFERNDIQGALASVITERR